MKPTTTAGVWSQGPSVCVFLEDYVKKEMKLSSSGLQWFQKRLRFDCVRPNRHFLFFAQYMIRIVCSDPAGAEHAAHLKVSFLLTRKKKNMKKLKKNCVWELKSSRGEHAVR